MRLRNQAKDKPPTSQLIKHTVPSLTENHVQFPLLHRQEDTYFCGQPANYYSWT